jgi:hypothetical protein
MKFRVTCRICGKSSDCEDARDRSNWAQQHTLIAQCIPLWDVEDVKEEQTWQSA